MASNRRFYTEKIIKPCPPSNPDCHCNEIHTPEGTYSLMHEIYQESTQPQFTSGTHVSFFCPTLHRQHGQYLTLPTTRKTSSFSTNSSISDQAIYSSENDTWAMSSVDEEENEDDSNSSSNNNSYPEIIPPTVTLLDSNNSLQKSISDNNNNTNYGLLAPTILHPSISDSQLFTLNTANINITPPPLPPQTTTTVPASVPVFNNNNTDTSNSNGGSLSSLFGHHRHHHHHHHSRSNSSSTSSNHPKKPKTSLSKLKSCFIEYVTNNEQYSKILNERTNFDSNIFYNVGLNFFWNDEHCEPKDYISKLSFGKAYPTCHDINSMTSSKDHLDVIIGFSSGDFIWYDTVCNRYSRINKNGIMNGSSVTMVKWIPDSEDLFMASFDDGSILILDKERDDQAFILPEPQSWAEEHFQITKPHKHSKHNPVAHWRVSQKGITAFAFSPNHQYVATVGKDGLMRTIDYTNERLCDVFVGYYGRLLCVAWSPDGHYILTGGQDDLVTIWSFKETRIIARCQGHRSWVTGVAFDPLHCDDKDYRFASVGEDCKLLLWDFSVNALHKPKQKTRKLSITTTPTLPPTTPLSESIYKKDTNNTNNNNNNNAGFGKRFRKRSSIFGNSELLLQPIEATQHVRLPTIHPALSKCQVPFLQPIVKQIIHPDPCVDIVYRDDSIVTTDRRGRIRAWGRPSSFIIK